MAYQTNGQQNGLSELSMIDTLSERGQHELDKYFSPERRERLYSTLQANIVANPKLSAFLAINALLTGTPLLCFAIFTLSTGIFSISIGLLIGLGGAIIFTLTCAGTALLFLIPTVFFTTMTACFLFCCGIAGYYLLQLASGARTRGSKPSLELRESDNLDVTDTGRALVNGVESPVKGKPKLSVTFPEDQEFYVTIEGA